MCCFYRSCIEGGRDHLFFQCRFSERILREILSTCLVDDQNTVWEDIKS